MQQILSERKKTKEEKTHNHQVGAMKIECRNCEAFCEGNYRGGNSYSELLTCRRHAPLGDVSVDSFPRVHPWDWCLEFVPRTRGYGELIEYKK